MVSNDWETNKLGELIAKEEEIEKQLIEQLADCRQRKKSLVQSKAMLMGRDFQDYARKSIPDLLEIMFRKYGGQHIRSAALLMQSEFGRVVATQTISGALIRYVQKGKRFKKLGKNFFDIADDEYQKYM